VFQSPKQRPLINKTLSTLTSYQQGLIVGKIGVCVCVVCVCPLCSSLPRWLRFLFNPHQVNCGGVQKPPTKVSLYKSHTTEEPLRRHRSDRYCQRVCVVGHLLDLHVKFPDHVFWTWQMSERLPRVILGVRKVTSPDRNSRLLFLVRHLSFTTSTKYCGLSLLTTSNMFTLVRITTSLEPVDLSPPHCPRVEVVLCFLAIPPSPVFVFSSEGCPGEECTAIGSDMDSDLCTIRTKIHFVGWPDTLKTVSGVFHFSIYLLDRFIVVYHISGEERTEENTYRWVSV
jgi:hypothetical protein